MTAWDIDYHSHILSGMDDGAETPEESVAMIRAIASLGFHTILATPHFKEGIYENRRELILKNVKELNELIQKNDLELAVYPGSEILLTPNSYQLLLANQLMTLYDAGNEILVELPFDYLPFWAEDLLDKISRGGLIPVLAHPERYDWLTETVAKQFHARGIHFQMNLGSLTIANRRLYHRAKMIYQLNLADRWGTDAHSLVDIRRLIQTPQIKNQHIGVMMVGLSISKSNKLSNETLNTTLPGRPFVFPLVSVKRERWDFILKRIMDIAISFILILFLFPLWPVIFAMIKLDSPGPVFFNHVRIGKGGKRFKFYKFRTMYHNSQSVLEQYLAASQDSAKNEVETFYKLRNDPRVTRIGKWLRTRSIDELPQLFNVLRGDMSLVGPRPIVPEEIIRYGAAYAEYITVQPGITGLWQVNGRNNLPYNQRLILNRQYIENWSLGLDLKILWRTISVVLSKRGAY